MHIGVKYIEQEIEEYLFEVLRKHQYLEENV